MNSNNAPKIDVFLSTAVENLAERMDRLTGAVDRLTARLTPLPHEYGPPPPYPLSIIALIEQDSDSEMEMEQQVITAIECSQSSGNSDNSPSSSNSSEEDSGEETDSESEDGADSFDDIQKTEMNQLLLSLDFISTRTAHTGMDNSARDESPPVSNKEEMEGIADEDQKTIGNGGNGNDEDDIQTARAVPSETNLASTRTHG